MTHALGGVGLTTVVPDVSVTIIQTLVALDGALALATAGYATHRRAGRVVTGSTVLRIRQKVRLTTVFGQEVAIGVVRVAALVGVVRLDQAFPHDAGAGRVRGVAIEGTGSAMVGARQQIDFAAICRPCIAISGVVGAVQGTRAFLVALDR